jgi:hypothetical protein
MWTRIINWDEIARVKVWVKISLGQMEGRGTGREDVRVEEQAIEDNGPKWKPVERRGCKGEAVLCWSEEGEPWDGCDLTVVLQEAVFFL